MDSTMLHSRCSKSCGSVSATGSGSSASVFAEMEAELLEFDADAGMLRVGFPVRERYLNPYGSMQGGMVAAAVDNTVAPLSVLVAPPNVTRRLELTYSRPITLETRRIVVTARLERRDGLALRFVAEVTDDEGARLARAEHLVLDCGAGP